MDHRYFRYFNIIVFRSDHLRVLSLGNELYILTLVPIKGVV